MLDLARISYEAQRTHFSIPRMGVHECEWDELSPDMQARYVDGVRSVLLAIREPDEGMARAGHAERQWGSVSVTFTAMIDHIIGEETA